MPLLGGSAVVGQGARDTGLYMTERHIPQREPATINGLISINGGLYCRGV